MGFNEVKRAFRLIRDGINLWWGDWVNGVVVSLVTLLASLTVLLAGPAIMGVWAVCDDLTEGVRTGIAGWWEGFKRYFWQGLLWGGINLAVGLVLGTAFWFYLQLENAWAPLLVLFLAGVSLFWGLIQFYTPAFLIEQKDKSLWLAWKNSFLTALASPGMSLVIGLFVVTLSAASIALFFPLYLGTIPLLGIVSVLVVRDWFETAQVKT